MFRCGSVNSLIDKCLKPHKDSKKQQKKVCFNERYNCASQKDPKNGDDDNNQKMYASMSQMSDIDEISSRYFGDSSQ